MYKILHASMIKVFGKIIFPEDNVPDSLSNSSQLKVEFSDISIMDAPKTVLGSVLVDLKNYVKGTPLQYSITTKKPQALHDFYSVSAVLNVGWKPTEGGDEWIRHKDYLNDTMHSISLKENQNEYEKDIEVVYYA